MDTDNLSETSKPEVNREYKDSLFRFLFKEPSNALSLYNAVNGTNYDNVEDLEITTLHDVIYMKMKNDLSFIFDKSMDLYEHQSSYNPNMPLRGLLYFAELYKNCMSESESIYGRKLITIPTPEYIVFYNGPEKDMQEDERLLRLSDAFDHSPKFGEFEWTARMINLNSGHNESILSACKLLDEYSIFVGMIKTYNKTMPIKDAINRAVDECIERNILRDVLLKSKKEVYNMCLTEFNEENYTRICREEGREEGRAEGREEGRAEGREEGIEKGIAALVSVCKDFGLNLQQIAQKLIQQFELSPDSATAYAKKYW